MTQPPTLDYQSPVVLSPHRKRAIRFARGNGLGSVFLGFCVGASFVSWAVKPDTTRGAHIVLSLILGLYAASFLVGGTLYLIAAGKMKRPNLPWERTCIIAACVQSALASLILIACLLSAANEPDRPGEFVTGALLKLAIVVSLLFSINAVKQTHIESIPPHEDSLD